MVKIPKKRTFAFIALFVILLIVFSENISAESSEISSDGKTAVLFIPGIHHKYIGEAGIFRWSEDWKGKDIGSNKVDNKEFAWQNVLKQAENMGFDAYILFEKGKSYGGFVDGGILGHKVNEEMIENSVNQLMKEGYNQIVITGHSQAGPNIFRALKIMSEKDATKLNHIQSIRLFDPAFASPIGSFATEPLVLPMAKLATGKLGTSLSPSEKDLAGRNNYLNQIRQSMPYMGKVFSQYNIPVYLMYAKSGIVSREEIKNNAQTLAKNGCKVFLFSPKTGSMKFGDYKEGNIGYLYKKDAPDPSNPKQQVPTESKLAHTPKLESPENKIATNFLLYGLSKPNKAVTQSKRVTADYDSMYEKDMGGVYIDPEIVDNMTVENGVILITLKEKVLGYRPSRDSLSWPIKLPEGIE